MPSKKPRPSRSRRGLASGVAHRGRDYSEGPPPDIWSVVCLVLGPLLVIGGLFFAFQEVALDVHSVSADASVTGVGHSARGGWTSIDITFTAAGKTVRTNVEGPVSGPDPRPSEAVSVDYVPWRPSLARLHGQHSVLAVVILPLGMAVTWFMARDTDFAPWRGRLRRRRLHRAELARRRQKRLSRRS